MTRAQGCKSHGPLTANSMGVRPCHVMSDSTRRKPLIRNGFGYRQFSCPGERREIRSLADETNIGAANLAGPGIITSRSWDRVLSEASAR